MINNLDLITESKRRNKKLLAMLIDPDKCSNDLALQQVLISACSQAIDLIFIGGSLITNGSFEKVIGKIRNATNKPLIIFPGNSMQVSSSADSILLLSLISGRNPEFLIGQQVLAAPNIKASGLEVIPTGYMLIDCGKPTAASYMSHSQPIPYDKHGIAACTALAGQQLGLKAIYIDGGSGAAKPVSNRTIEAVKKEIDIPLIVGGGIQNPEDLSKAFNAGADIVVIGTALEKDPNFLATLTNVNQTP